MLLVDIYKVLYTNSKGYTFYSEVNQSNSKIENMLEYKANL